jgi:hypothetical protein
VCDAAGKAPDAFDLGGLRQPVFEQAAIGNVAGNAQMSGLVNAGAEAALDDPGAGRPVHAMFAPRLTQGDQLSPIRSQRFTRFNEQLIERFPNQLGRGYSEQDARCWVGFGHNSLIVEDEQRVRGAEEHRMEEALTFLEGRFGLDARRHVQQVAANLHEVVAGIELPRHAGDRVDQRAVSPAEAGWVVFQPLLAPELVDEIVAFLRVDVERDHVGANCLVF